MRLARTTHSAPVDERAPLNAASLDYPKPRVPVLPIASWSTWLGRRKCRYRSVLEAGSSVAVTRGAAAIALALEHAGVTAGEKVLLPAFHCRSMIEPFLAAGAQPIYYGIAEDLSVDLKDIQNKLADNPRVLLVTHYFGFYQNMQTLRSWCDTRHIMLIEDCAHAFFGEIDGHPVGWYGDYAIASARKFFAIEDGGYLISARHPLRGLPMRTGGCAFNIKAALDILETAITYNRLAPLSFVLTPLLGLKSLLWDEAKAYRHAGAAASIGPGISKGYKYLDIEWIHKRMSFASRCLIRLSGKTRITDKRRANYQRLAAGLSNLPAARPLVRDLPADVVPYMFPLIVDRPELVFPVLKNKGVPIWRWEDPQTTECEVSHRYSRCLFQLPCHQALRDSEIDWIIASVRQTLLNASP